VSRTTKRTRGTGHEGARGHESAAAERARDAGHEPADERARTGEHGPRGGAQADTAPDRGRRTRVARGLGGAPAQPRELGPLAEATPVQAIGRPAMSHGEHFRRDHFPAPETSCQAWELEITGAVANPLTLTLADLHALVTAEARVVLECAGHRRMEHDPPPAGLPWELGAVGEATWGGAPLKRVLGLAVPLASARFVRLVGADRGETARGSVEPYARTIPLDKAQEASTLLAHAVNGEPISCRRGGPVRAIVPGWYATDSVKWLTTVELREEPGEGFFDVDDYRFRALGDEGPGLRMDRMPIHALITSPTDAAQAGPVLVEGAVWGGRGGVARVEVSIDGGNWQIADLNSPRGPFARRFWSLMWEAPAGEHQLAVRATDASGEVQPSEPPPNAAGYANNSIHRIACRIYG